MKGFTIDAKIKKGNWKVALVLALGLDYHWYRQNTDGTWSHKQGSGPVTNLDGDGINGHLITDIKTADRGIYTVLIGYFEVGKCIE